MGAGNDLVGWGMRPSGIPLIMSGESTTQGLAAAILAEKDYERLTDHPPAFEE